ncbi:hypothetical protein B0A50_03521 [Salinomyces thailandicus]|uniref:Uncharacterized protein n=1 Tax=Salinomyces thailandicus TaxID=706561 RepID=A0A4U0U3K7_9PEZI|nr:hypothetical protein B0A50_03521 [Salinomyces thailandica]
MNGICLRCALRLQRTAQPPTPSPSTTRTLSSTTARRKHHGIPTFFETPQPDLNAVLTALRTTHFIPAALHAPDRRLILGKKNKQQLADNPTTVSIAGEEIPLQWLDRTRDIPNRTTLFHRAVSLMAAEDHWRNLPVLLTGLNNAGLTLPPHTLSKAVRKALVAGRIGLVLQCLEQTSHTGVSLANEEVLQSLLAALHTSAQTGEYSESATRAACKSATHLSHLLENPAHNSKGASLRDQTDPRFRPEVLAVPLELVSIYAYKHTGGQDPTGAVKTLTTRLLDALERHPSLTQPSAFAPQSEGPQLDMIRGLPIYQGLWLAEKILGSEMPKPELARRVCRDYGAGLRILAEALRAGGQAKEGSYGGVALWWWEGRLAE